MGEEFVSTGEGIRSGDALSGGRLFRWLPGSRAQYVGFVHSGSAPGAGVLNGSPLPDVRFGAVPPTAGSTGLVLTGRTRLHRLLVLWDGSRVAWHRDFQWNVGPPVVDQGLIFLGAGSDLAYRGIAALEAGTGADRWIFAPTGMGPRWADSPHMDPTAKGLLAVVAGRVYGQAGGSIVALDQASSKLQ